MDIEHLKSLIDQAIGDYSQLGQSQKYKDTKKAFKQKGNEVLNTLSAQLPMNKDGSPNYENALNLAGGGIAGTIDNHLAKWLASQGIVDDIVTKASKLSKAIGEHDNPNLKVYGIKGEEGGPWFQSNDTQSHLARVNLMTSEFLNKFKNELGLSNDQVKRAIASTTTHDAGKLKTDIDLLSRTAPSRDAPDLNFQTDITKVPSLDVIQSLPDDDPYKHLMLQFYKRNGANPEFLPYRNFTSKDLAQMDNHAAQSLRVGKEFGFDPSLTRDAALHHIDADMTGGYPYNLGKQFTELPVEARAGSLADIFDAITDTRYGQSRKSLDTSMKFFSEHAKKRGVPSRGTQIDANMYDLFVNSDLPEHFYNNISTKRGEDLKAYIDSKLKK